MQYGKRIHIARIRDKEKTLHEQPRRVSNFAQGFLIKWRINESACSNQCHI